MNLTWAAIGALVGLPAGTSLRDQVVRLCVRSGEPDQACCPACGADLAAWPAVRCAHCGGWHEPPASLEVLTAAVLALLFARLGGRPEVAAFAYLGVVGVALAKIDVAVRRLPDRLTFPTYPALIVLLGLACVVDHDIADFERSLLGGLALVCGFLALGLLSGGQLGGGDIKLAGLVGIVLGWRGAGAIVAGVWAGFVLAAIVGLGLLAFRRIGRRSELSFGPFLLVGALLALVLTGN